MKRATSIILVLVICLSLCACSSGGMGGENTTKSNEIELTLDNYDDYLKLNVQCSRRGNVSLQIARQPYVGQNILYCVANSEGTSSNFNYNNVSIEVKFYGKYGISKISPTAYGQYASLEPEKYESFDIIQTFETDISGTIKESSIKIAELNGWVIQSLDYKYEIIKISGTVSPA